MSEKKQRTVTVVTVFCILVHEGKVLMLRRGHPPYEGTCTVPGGHKEHGETLRDACAREMLEESGLTVKNLQYAGFMEVYFPVDTRDFISFYYVATEFTGTPNGAGPDGEVFWVDIDKAAEMPEAHPAFRALAPYFLHNRFPFQARATIDANAQGEYVVEGPDAG